MKTAKEKIKEHSLYLNIAFNDLQDIRDEVGGEFDTDGEENFKQLSLFMNGDYTSPDGEVFKENNN